MVQELAATLAGLAKHHDILITRQVDLPSCFPFCASDPNSEKPSILKLR